jgi:exopolyphosphatase/guanosine-5'-triphosphate,3'-diphosphate pyrophosphatase
VEATSTRYFHEQTQRRKPLPLELLRDYYKELNSFNLPERIRKFALREDRADVIVPALLIYINVMRWAGSEEIYVPKIGLADGLINHLWEELKKTNTLYA